MEIGFDIDVNSNKEADDVAEQVLAYLISTLGVTVSDYWVQI